MMNQKVRTPPTSNLESREEEREVKKKKKKERIERKRKTEKEKERCNKGGGGVILVPKVEARPWSRREKRKVVCSDIVPELLGEIYKGLVLSDKIRFCCICKAWSSIASESEKPHPPVPDPWLMLGGGPDNILRHKFHCLSDKKVYKFDKILQGFKVLGSSSNGWFLTTADPQLKGVRHTIILVNPILNIQVKLPKNCPVHSNLWYIEKLLVVRTRQSCGDHSIVITLLFVLSGSGRLGFYRLGDHRLHRSNRFFSNNGDNALYDDIIFYNGKLYALASQRDQFEVDVLCLGEHTKLGLQLWRRYVVQGIVINSQLQNMTDQKCLVESFGDLLVVRRQYHDIFTPLRNTAALEVFKLQLTDDDASSAHAAKLQSLGGQALFLGMDGCISLPVGKFSLFEENHIYFIGEMEHGVYSLKDGTIKGIPYLSSFLGPRIILPYLSYILLPLGSFWFVPTAEDTIVHVDMVNTP